MNKKPRGNLGWAVKNGKIIVNRNKVNSTFASISREYANLFFLEDFA